MVCDEVDIEMSKRLCKMIKSAIDEEREAGGGTYRRMHDEAVKRGQTDVAYKIKQIQSDEKRHRSELERIYANRCLR